MKNKTLTLIFATILMTVVSCKQEGATKITSDDMKTIETEKAMVGKLPKVTFDKLVHDFGTIAEGDKVETEFMVTNTGESDLIITNAEATCGCTIPVFPKEPIKPGDSAPIKVSFDSANKAGEQSKTVTLTTNTANVKEIVTIKATVTPKK